MSPDPAVALARVRAICLALPAAAEKLSHGAPAFFVEKGRFFAYFAHDHHGDARTAVKVRTSAIEEQEAMIAADPELYYRPAYIGHAGWLGIRLDRANADWEQVAGWIEGSWALAAPTRLRDRHAR